MLSATCFLAGSSHKSLTPKKPVYRSRQYASRQQHAHPHKNRQQASVAHWRLPSNAPARTCAGREDLVTAVSNGHKSSSADGSSSTGGSSNLPGSAAAKQQPQVPSAQQTADTNWLPVIETLLRLLTDKDELSRLDALSGPARTMTVRLQNDVNKMARLFSGIDVNKALETYGHIKDRYSPQDKPSLLKLPTSTASNPKGVPTLYYAVASRSTVFVDFLLTEGADASPEPAQADAATTWRQVPPLALAIAQRDHKMVQLLLQRGADPLAIPYELYVDAMREIGLHAVPQPEESKAGAVITWCKATDDYGLLRSCLDTDKDCGLTLQYWLTRALKLPGLTEKTRQVAEANALQRVPELRLAVVGQEIGSTLLYHHIMVYAGMNGKEPNAHKPLVLLLAGPPGHGKTLLGKSMQRVLPGAEYHFEDCGRINHRVDLWGTSPSFQGSEIRPTFADFLVKNSGRRSVVVLDEFEKMESRRGIQDSFLRVFEEGQFVDASTQTAIDCSRTIFLLTTNAADRHILNFWEKNSKLLLAASLHPSNLMTVTRPLTREIKKAMAARTSFSIVSRLHGVVPFLPFTEAEQKLVVQVALLDMKAALIKPPDENIGRVHGNITLILHDQVKVCGNLAAETYNEAEGARAVVNEVNNLVDMQIKTDWLEEHLDNSGTAELTAPSDQVLCHDITYKNLSDVEPSQ